MGALIEDSLLSVKQVAAILGTSERFPRRLIEERRIEFVHIGRHVRIAESVLAAFIAAQTVPVRGRRVA
ncbi:MAG: helix-turn-helix domain-containing protein [Actinophytocola sp.]|uniref:helix-turn-helix domain-containing protein n=1 Tax=Actinophytocola sp. TaxID=1872138 RepID=UPI003C719614